MTCVGCVQWRRGGASAAADGAHGRQTRPLPAASPRAQHPSRHLLLPARRPPNAFRFRPNALAGLTTPPLSSPPLPSSLPPSPPPPRVTRAVRGEKFPAQHPKPRPNAFRVWPNTAASRTLVGKRAGSSRALGGGRWAALCPRRGAVGQDVVRVTGPSRVEAGVLFRRGRSRDPGRAAGGGKWCEGDGVVQRVD